MTDPARRSYRIPVAMAAVTAAALAVVAPAVSVSAHERGDHQRGDHQRGDHQRRPVALQLLAINDFHGNLEPPSGSGGLITNPDGTRTPAGGAANLATHLRNLRDQAAARGAASLTVAAGDLVGASPLISAAFHDEPTIEALNLAGLQVASVGNHEFDEGYRELQRLDAGGCLPDGPTGKDNQNSCPDNAHPFPGAAFAYLAANVTEQATDTTILPPYWIKKVKGVKVGFIGMTLEGTPDIVTKSGVAGLTFGDEVQTANALVPKLRKKGVRSIVVLLHEGGFTADPKQFDACPGISGPIVDIAKGLSADIDAIITGHTHQGYNCRLPDPRGNPRLVTSASSFGRLVTEIDLTIDRRTRDVVRATSTATNHVVTRDVAPNAATAPMTALVAKYKGLVADIENKVIGTVATKAAVSRTGDASGESPLGNLIADAQLADPTVISGGVKPVIAFMNPGGIRNDLAVDPTSGEVTYGSAFTVQPFNNFLVSMDLAGAQIEALLEQQFAGPNATANKVLQVSAGFSYTWKASGADRVDPAGITLGGVPLDPAATYRIVTNNFLADGGDNFPAFTLGTNRLFGGLDIDAFANFLTAKSPYTPGPADRINVG